jgi:hypothetical protein
MSTLSLITHFDMNVLETMVDYDGIRQRFAQGFERFVAAKKYQAVCALLPDEIQNECLVKSPNFIQAVTHRVDDEALLEKRYIFLSVNPQAVGNE